MQQQTSPEPPIVRPPAARVIRRLVGTTVPARRRRVALLVGVLVAFGVTGGALTAANHRGQPSRQAKVEQQARGDAAARADRAQREAVPPIKPAWVSPMPGAKTTSCFGMRWGAPHKGIDLALPENAPIQAAGAGTVKDAGWLYTGYGYSVVIDHGGGVLTHYAHMNKTAVKKGQQVAPGDVIGYEGATGDSTGPHLHFEVHLGELWKQVDPQPWMKARGVDLQC